MNRKMLIAGLLLTISWLVYHSTFPAVFWDWYFPARFIEISKEPGYLFYTLMGFHDVLVNLLITLPFALIASRLTTQNMTKPVLFAALVGFLFLHSHMLEIVSAQMSPRTWYTTISAVGFALLLPLTFATVSFFKMRRSA